VDWYSLGAVETPVIPNFFILSLSSAEEFQLIMLLKIFSTFCCRPNYQGFVIEEPLGEIMKGVKKKE
jgi:hypothetical protein